jgi:hypothetical protein
MFAAILVVPAIWCTLSEPNAASFARENRRPAPLPAFSSNTDSVKRFPTRFESWFDDRLPFREKLLEWHAHWKVNELGVSSSDKVILGKSGWLFLDEARSENNSRTGGAAEQAAAWLTVLQRRHTWLSERGIQYVVVLTPEKHDVYAEFLPARYHPLSGSTGAEMLAASAQPWILDLRPVLIEATKTRDVYFQTDTHWNDDGAYEAYAAILSRIGSSPKPRAAFDVSFQPHLGDLVQMLHLPNPVTEATQRLHLRASLARQLADDVPLPKHLHSPDHLRPQAWGRPDANLPRGVLLHDSFGERLLLPLLAEHFSFLAYAPTPALIPEMIEQMKPGIVIQQICTRKINRHAPVDDWAK